jgi:hypothetical protein
MKITVAIASVMLAAALTACGGRDHIVSHETAAQNSPSVDAQNSPNTGGGNLPNQGGQNQDPQYNPVHPGRPCALDPACPPSSSHRGQNSPHSGDQGAQQPGWGSQDYYNDGFQAMSKMVQSGQVTLLGLGMLGYQGTCESGTFGLGLEGPNADNWIHGCMDALNKLLGPNPSQ